MRAATTIVLSLRDLLVRADFARDGSCAVTRLASDPAASLDERVALALADGSASRAVHVLADDVYTQYIDLDARALRGLGAAELAAAIAYELQLGSGLAAADARVAHRASPTGGFLACEFAESDFVALERAIERSGSRLVSLAHPCGLAMPLADGVGLDAAFTRCERFADLIAVVDKPARGSATARIARPGTEEATRLAAIRCSESLIAPGVVAPRDGVAVDVDVTADPTLERWLRGWGAEFDAGRALALKPAARPWSRAHRVAAALVFATVVAVACWFDRASFERARREAQRAALTAREPADSRARAVAEAARLDAELRELRATAPKPAVTPRRWDATLPARTLSAIAEHRPGGVVVHSLDFAPTGGTVRGFAVEYGSVDAFATALGARLGADSLRTTIRERRLLRDGATAGLYEFVLALESTRGSDVEVVR